MLTSGLVNNDGTVRPPEAPSLLTVLKKIASPLVVKMDGTLLRNPGESRGMLGSQKIAFCGEIVMFPSRNTLLGNVH
jgi:hypothetical protein